MANVMIHIGLHKTVTRFFEPALRNQLLPQRFLFNPPELMAELRLALRPRGRSPSGDLETAVGRAREQAGHRTLVISDPEISGNMFDNHANCEDNLRLMREMFPEATVIYFVRDQADWLHSAYRQGLVKGRSAPIQLFLNFRDGGFQPRLARRVDRMRTIDARGLRFLEIYQAYAEAYGPGRVYLLRQEDLRQRWKEVSARLADALGVEELPEPPPRVSGNRAFSALAIRLFHPRTMWMPNLDRVELSDTDQPGHGNWLIHPLRQVRTILIRHVFDRLLYIDWDLLAQDGMRERLDQYYADERARLERAARIILEQGPGPAALAATKEGA
jgi:hypothetical protein